MTDAGWPHRFAQPILNSPDELPSRYWELDASGQPTNSVFPGALEGRSHHADPEAEEAPGGVAPCRSLAAFRVGSRAIAAPFSCSASRSS